MVYGRFLFLCATFGALAVYVQSQNAKIPATRFTCRGRPSGYYADIETGCQVYHMCDGLGRQFSYSCPNTTLFQQRMLICDHWYMVNCTNSESDYNANLLIGQRDKPFVSDSEMSHRTPRPDILSVPLNNNYYEGLKEAESKFPIHPGNSIVGTADTISSSNNNGLDHGKNNYRPPTGWSTGTAANNYKPGAHNDHDQIAGSASQRPAPTYQPKPETEATKPTTTFIPTSTIPPPSQDLHPPPRPTTTPPPTSEEFSIDARMKDDSVIKFINRFDPNSPDSYKTSMTREQIENINKQLPPGQSSAEVERTPKKQKNTNNFNVVKNENKESKTEGTRFDSVNVKPTLAPVEDDQPNIPTPSRELLPPKKDFADGPTTTMGPPIYYEWKWAVPAFGLEPPKFDNTTNNRNYTQPKTNISGRSPFSSVTRPTPRDYEPTPSSSNTEYNISSYFVPDYVFPLDKPHPGYENDGAQTSFQVKVPREGRAFGENPNCPQCHPAYLKPGTCEPCIVNR